MFFGCRGESKDFYFRSEWEELMRRHPPSQEEEAGGGFRMFCAFSRDQEEKVYVQHRILSEEFLLKKFLYRRRGGFFLAGSARQMPDQVLESLRHGLRETCGLSQEEAEEFTRRMEKDGRLQTETWS